MWSWNWDLCKNQTRQSPKMPEVRNLLSGTVWGGRQSLAVFSGWSDPPTQVSRTAGEAHSRAAGRRGFQSLRFRQANDKQECTVWQGKDWRKLNAKWWKCGFINKDKLLWPAGGGSNAFNNLGHFKISSSFCATQQFPSGYVPWSRVPSCARKRMFISSSLLVEVGVGRKAIKMSSEGEFDKWVSPLEYSSNKNKFTFTDININFTRLRERAIMDAYGTIPFSSVLFY